MGPYCLQYRLLKYIADKQMVIIRNGRLRVGMQQNTD